MKLLPVYKPGTVKKALLAFVGIGVTGAVIKYKSHSEAHLQGPAAGLEDWQDEHGLTWYLQEALQVASGSAKEASNTLLHLLGSLRHAWAVRYVPSGSGGSAAQRVSFPVAVAEFLSSMSEEPDGQGGAASRVGYVLAGYKVLDWLLDTAVANPGSPEHLAVERFLAKVLSDEEATCALLERPGAIPKLLRLVASELASDKCSSSQAGQAPLHLGWQQQGQQQQGQWKGKGRQPQDDIEPAEAHQTSLHPLMRAVIHGGKLPVMVQQEDMQAVLIMACEPGQGHDVQLLAMQLLTGLAQTSVLNCKAIAGAGGGRRLAGLAASSSTGVDVDGMQLEIARLMTTLARNCPDRGDLKMSRWLYHLLCFAADASANRNWQLAAASLQAFANCLRAGSKIQDSLLRGNALPLLHQLADWQQQQAQHGQQPGGTAGSSSGSSGPLMRAAIANAVGSLVEARRERFPLGEREHWGEVLLGWMSEQPLDESLQHHELLKALAGALAGLAAIPGPDGLHLAHAWLAEMIVHLSRQIEAARPGRKAPQQQARGAAVASGGSPSGPTTASGNTGTGSTASWWKFWAKDSPSPTTGAVAAAPSSLVTVVDSASEEVSAMAEAAAVVEFEAELPPSYGTATERPHAGKSSSGDGTGPLVGIEQQGQEDGWGSTPWWKPWGSPESSSKQGELPSPMPAAAAGPAAPTVVGAAGGGPEAAAAETLVRRPTSDPELSEFLRGAPVGPLYARSVAAELLEASGRVGTYQEPPPDAEELMSPDAIAAYAKVAAAVDMEVADKALCQALKVLCALVSGDADKQRWIRLVGVLPLLHRLTIGHPRDIPEVTDPDYFSESLPLCVRRQSARLLAMLTADLEGAKAVRKGGWVPWLQNVAASSDCKISSCAARALLHLESAAALQRHTLALRPPWQLAKQLKRSTLPPLLPGPEPDTEGDVLEEARQRLQAVRRRLDRQLDAVRPPVLPQYRLVMSDGVHLFDPLATHHETLAREGTASRSKDAPLVDVVFVHGIRGGAFATWRREGVLQHGQARENLERDTCWPGAWLARELPEARLLTIEYPAPASGWEGESLPLTHTAVRLMDKLTAAGVGNRPVIFVAHSMGGLVVKELLARAAADDSDRFHSLAENARGAVFYSVPHFGAKLAAYGWQLRYVGGSPAAAVEQLRPGPHLDAINSCVKAMYKSGRLPVLSFSEGLQTRLGYMKASIVPHESAFPGYGEFVVLSHHDHINVCKPLDKDDPAYAKLADFLKARVEEVKAEVAEQIVEGMDGLEPAV